MEWTFYTYFWITISAVFGMFCCSSMKGMVRDYFSELKKKSQQPISYAIEVVHAYPVMQNENVTIVRLSE